MLACLLPVTSGFCTRARWGTLLCVLYYGFSTLPSCDCNKCASKLGLLLVRRVSFRTSPSAQYGNPSGRAKCPLIHGRGSVPAPPTGMASRSRFRATVKSSITPPGDAQEPSARAARSRAYLRAVPVVRAARLFSTGLVQPQPATAERFSHARLCPRRRRRHRRPLARVVCPRPAAEAR